MNFLNMMVTVKLKLTLLGKYFHTLEIQRKHNMRTNLKYLFGTDKFIKFQQTNLKTRQEDEDPDISEVNIATFKSM